MCGPAIRGSRGIVGEAMKPEEIAAIKALVAAALTEGGDARLAIGHYESRYVGNRDGCEHLKRLTVETGVGTEECVGCEYDKLEAEVARLTAELSVTQRDLNGANAYIDDLRGWRDRLTEERREKEITIGALRDRGDEYREERDQQREDIRRLVGTLHGLVLVFGASMMERGGAWTVEEYEAYDRGQNALAEMKERYDA